MNRAAANITLYHTALLLISCFMLVACSTGNEDRAALPHVQIIGEISTNIPPSVTPIKTLTPSPTAFPSRTPQPTLRQVVVSRIHENINPSLITPIAKGAKLPDLTLSDIYGNEIAFTEHNQPLVLNFWSVGCGSCFFEFPLLQEFYEYHSETNLQIIGINIADFPNETRIIGEQMGITFPLVVDYRAELFATYFNGAVVPTTIFITAEGAVSNVILGSLDVYNLDIELQKIGLPAYER